MVWTVHRHLDIVADEPQQSIDDLRTSTATSSCSTTTSTSSSSSAPCHSYPSSSSSSVLTYTRPGAAVCAARGPGRDDTGEEPSERVLPCPEVTQATK